MSEGEKMSDKTETIINLKDGGKISIQGEVPNYIIRQIEKVAYSHGRCTVLTAEGEVLSVLKKLSSLTAQRYGLERLRAKSKTAREAIRASELAEYEDMIDEITPQIQKIKKKFDKMWSKIRKAEKRKKEEMEENQQKKTSSETPSDNQEVEITLS